MHHSDNKDMVNEVFSKLLTALDKITKSNIQAVFCVSEILKETNLFLSEKLYHDCHDVSANNFRTEPSACSCSMFELLVR